MKCLLVALLALLCTLAPAAPALAGDDDPDDRIIVSGPLVVDRDETVNDVVVVDGNVLIRGTVKGDVVVVDGDVTVRGRVRGDIVTVAGKAYLGHRAHVSGDLVYFDKRPKLLPGARLSGDTTKFDGGQLGGFSLAAIAVWGAVSLSVLLLGLLLLLLAPRAADAVARTAKKSWAASVGVGLLTFILLPILGIAACITLLGIPFGAGLLLALFPLLAISYATTAFVVGRLIVKGARIPAFLVGLLILRLLALIPFGGGVIGLLAMIFGLGVLFMTLFRVRGGS